MRVTVIPFVISALGTIPKCFVKGLEDLEIRGQVEYIIKISQNTKKSPGKIDEIYCHSDSSESPSVNPGVKNSPGVRESKKKLW